MDLCMKKLKKKRMMIFLFGLNKGNDDARNYFFKNKLSKM